MINFNNPFYEYNNIFNPFPTDGYLGCYKILVIINSALMNIHICAYVHTHTHKYPRCYFVYFWKIDPLQ